jgi:Ca2+/Na+ antiporter
MPRCDRILGNRPFVIKKRYQGVVSMSVLKGFGVTILSSLLFLLLMVFGVVFMLQSTILNADFVTAQVDKLDIPALVSEFTDEMIDEFPEEASFVDIEQVIDDIITEYEPWLKEQINTAIYAGYAYVKGESDTLYITISLDEVKESLRESLWLSLKDNLKLDFSGLPEDVIGPFLDEYYGEFAGQIPKGLLPEDIANLPEDELRPYLEQFLQEFTGEIPVDILPPDISVMIDDLLRDNFDEFYNEISEDIPSEYTTEDIPEEAREQITEARKYMGWAQTAYGALIGVMVLLAVAIALINRNVRETARSLGISLFVYGALALAGVIIARNVVPDHLPLGELPLSIQDQVLGIFNDFLAPMQTFSIGILVVGVVLIVVSIIYKPTMLKRGTGET